MMDDDQVSMSVRKVETKIFPLSCSDSNGEKPLQVIKIRNAEHLCRYRVILEVSGCKFEVLAKDLIAGIENATNYDDYI